MSVGSHIVEIRMSVLLSCIIFMGYAALGRAKNIHYHSVFGNTWYQSTDEHHGDTPMFVSKSNHNNITWNLWNAETGNKQHHLENRGLVTHLNHAVELEIGVTHVFEMIWVSGGQPVKGCDSKYWNESKYKHQCYDPNTKYHIVDGCNYEVHCLKDTGDFRIVLADSRGHRISHDVFEERFGDLEQASTEWDGFQWR